MDGGSAAKFLRLVAASTSLAPPLKSIADTVLEITTLATRFKTCASEWTEFRAYIEDAVATALRSVESVDVEQSEVKAHVEKLLRRVVVHDPQVFPTNLCLCFRTLTEVAKRIKARHSDPFWLQLGHFLDHPVMIAEMRQQVDDAVGLFKLGATIRVDLRTEKILKLAEKHDTVDPLLAKLPYVRGASWDPNRVCLPDTRQEIIESVLSWINTPYNATKTNIFLLTGVAGAGKSAIAHSVSQRLSESKQLLTSFFFDREIAERNNPKRLISTIATDLSRRDSGLASRIISAIQGDESLIGAPIARQFQDLILDPSVGYDCDHPLVIVLDALDEGCDIDLLRILVERASQLPHYIRIFMTSRMSPDMEKLRRKPHVHSESLDIYTVNNSNDIAVYIPYKLKQVAEEHDLGEDWPDLELVNAFQAKAGGLFLWVATTCDYLSSCYYPTRELQLLISASYRSGSSAESKMDSLYATILQACNWEDKEFADSCCTLLGGVVAAKSPLTLQALNALYQRVIMGSELALRQLSPLMTGLSNKPTNQPVRFLHLSLRDFLTKRAASPDAPTSNHIFAVEEKEHSSTLAELCLALMNDKLNTSIPGVGYCLNNKVQSSGIPTVQGHDVPEELMYACRFWLDHLLDTEAPIAADLAEQLEQFLSHKATLWIELVTAYSRYEGLSRLHQWVENKPLPHPALRALVFSQALAGLAHDLAERLGYMDRREEALLASRDEIVICRKLGAQGDNDLAGLARALSASVPYLRALNQQDEAIIVANEAIAIQRSLALSDSALDLAHSLYQLSTAYKDLQQRDAAIEAIEEAVQIQQSLSLDGQVTIMQNSKMALYLHGHAACLRALGQHEDSLLAIRRAVELRRELANKEPLLYTLDLASSLQSLSGSLSNLGQYAEALGPAEEAVELHRQVVKERPSGIEAVANSLEELSWALSRLGRNGEAVDKIQEAIEIWRMLTQERPAVFTSNLASSLLNFSHRLDKVGLKSGALLASQESVALQRQLAKDRPAVHTSALANSLNDLACYLSDHGRHEEALTTTQEAVELRRQLAAERPAVFTSDYANSLHNLSCYLFDLGRFDEALRTVQEAVKLYRQLASERPAVFNSDLALSLDQLSLCLNTVGRPEEAVVASKESVETYRPLFQQFPSVHSPRFSTALTQLADYLSAAGNEQEAADVRQEREELSLINLES